MGADVTQTVAEGNHLREADARALAAISAAAARQYNCTTKRYRRFFPLFHHDSCC